MQSPAETRRAERHQPGGVPAEEFLLRPLAGDPDPLEAARRLRVRGERTLLLERAPVDQERGYAVAATRPDRILEVRDGRLEETDREGRILFRGVAEDLIPRAEALLGPGTRRGDRPFFPAVAGYLGHGMAGVFEELFEGTRSLRPSGDPEAVLLVFSTLALRDAASGRWTLVHRRRSGEDRSEGLRELDRLEADLTAPLPPEAPGPRHLGEPRSLPSPERFREMVHSGRELVHRGDLCQVVLSRCLTLETDLSPEGIYRSLRDSNPSPYLFLLDLGDFRLVGSSPETQIRVRGRRVVSRPLAGTRPRGTTPEEDRRREAELQGDEKERAEHLMLVDLARNDLGRVCETGSVTVPDLMETERFSRVMHLVSQVEGRLREDAGPLEALRVSFPAGTVSGAPKVRALERIEELEATPRGAYAGALVFLDPCGDLDSCITLRTLVHRDGSVEIRTGAGVVADSTPEGELAETAHKAEALLRALRVAAGREEGAR